MIKSHEKFPFEIKQINTQDRIHSPLLEGGHANDYENSQPEF